MNKFSGFVLVAAFLGMQGSAWAVMQGGPEARPHNMMEEADTNHDGKISFKVPGCDPVWPVLIEELRTQTVTCRVKCTAFSPEPVHVSIHRT